MSTDEKFGIDKGMVNWRKALRASICSPEAVMITPPITDHRLVLFHPSDYDGTSLYDMLSSVVTSRMRALVSSFSFFSFFADSPLPLSSMALFRSIQPLYDNFSSSHPVINEPDINDLQYLTRKYEAQHLTLFSKTSIARFTHTIAITSFEDIPRWIILKFS